MKKTLTNNLGLKILALVIATIVWMAVINISDPVTTTNFYDVPVTIKNENYLLNQGKVYDIVDNSDFVRINVKAPRSVLIELEKNDFYVVADFSEVKGDNTVPISVSIGNSKVEEVTLDHNDIILEIDDLVHKSFDVECFTKGSPKENYVLKSVEPQPNSISVSGPASYLEKIDKVAITLDITDRFESIQANCRVELLNEDGENINSNRMSLSDEMVMVSADFDPTKTLDLKIETSGTPAVGYGVIEITTEPENITVSGRSADISNISSINIPGEELDINGLDKDLVKTINVEQYIPDELKESLSILNGGNVDIVVTIKPVEGKNINIPVSAITVKNLQSGLSYDFLDSDSKQLSYVSVTVYGLKDTVKEITSEQIKLSVDASALEAGKQHVQAQVQTPQGTYTEEIWLAMQLTED